MELASRRSTKRVRVGVSVTLHLRQRALYFYPDHPMPCRKNRDEVKTGGYLYARRSPEGTCLLSGRRPVAECPVCHTRQSRRNKKFIGRLDKKSGLKCTQNLDDAKKAKKVRYHITYCMPDGKQRWESVGAFEGLDPFSVTDAENALAKRKVQEKEKRIFDMLPESNQRFSELTEWYIGLEKVKALAYHKILKINLDSFNAVFGDYVVSIIKPANLENYQAKRKKILFRFIH